MFEDSSCFSSMNLPATSWLTNFAGIGKKLGPTIKGLWRSGAGSDGAKVKNTERGAHVVVEHARTNVSMSAKFDVRNNLKRIS